MNNISPGVKSRFALQTEKGMKAMLMVNTPQGREIERKMGEGDLSAEFDATTEGQYQFCVNNQEQRAHNIKVELKIGEYANDKI